MFMVLPGEEYAQEFHIISTHWRLCLTGKNFPFARTPLSPGSGGLLGLTGEFEKAYGTHRISIMISYSYPQLVLFSRKLLIYLPFLLRSEDQNQSEPWCSKVKLIWRQPTALNWKTFLLDESCFNFLRKNQNLFCMWIWWHIHDGEV